MKTKMRYEEAFTLALSLKQRLAPYCERIEIAGSVRRRKPECGDIELVAIPKIEPVVDLLGETVCQRSLLDQVLLDRYSVLKGKDKYKQVLVDDVPVDIYIQPDPATWGVNFTIRTGSADFAKWLVTSRFYGGALPGNMRVEDARIWCMGAVLETPEEQDVFKAIGIRWIEPEERVNGFWRRTREYALQESEQSRP